MRENTGAQMSISMASNQNAIGGMCASTVSLNKTKGGDESNKKSNFKIMNYSYIPNSVEGIIKEHERNVNGTFTANKNSVQQEKSYKTSFKPDTADLESKNRSNIRQYSAYKSDAGLFETKSLK